MMKIWRSEPFTCYMGEIDMVACKRAGLIFCMSKAKIYIDRGPMSMANRLTITRFIKMKCDNLLDKHHLITFPTFPDYMRKIMYTMNAIESLNSQFRKVEKAKLIFPNDESLMKMLYFATRNVSKKWTRIYANWVLVINQLNIMFEDALKKDHSPSSLSPDPEGLSLCFS